MSDEKKKNTMETTTLTEVPMEERKSWIEFAHGEFMSTLQEISRHAISIRFEPLVTGEQHVFILMPYFIALRDFE